MNFRYKLITIFTLSSVLLVFQNCSDGFKASEGSFSAASSGKSGARSKIVPVLTDWNDPFPAGIEDPDCMNSKRYNICMIYKNPVFANGTPFSPKLTPDTSDSTIEAKIMTYGLKVPESGNLANDNFVISDSPKPDAADNGGSWKFSYRDDKNRHYVAQISTFYWLNRQVTYMKEYTGAFYYEDLGAPVTAFSSGTKNNAFFDGRGITLGYIQLDGDNKRGDVGLDVGVIAHEAGHGNLSAASRGASSGGNQPCRDKNGCFGGIHEGQGDVHSFILFPERASLGEYFFNNTNGLRNPASVKRDGLSAQQIYNRRRGEVHDMGEVYASLWWETWVKAVNGSREQELATIFTEHLAGLGSNDNFTSAFEVIETITNKTAPGNSAEIISDLRAEYTRMGVDLP